MKVKLEKIFFIITIIIISLVMVYWINQKEGFHEDEIFSYGSSNYNLDNVFQRYGEKDEINQIIFDKILVGNVVDNIKFYLTNPNQFMKEYNNLVKQEKPIWKTKQEAQEYLTIGKADVLNYFSVYYNQSRDVHPPLFYFVVHLVSSIFFGMFSKYIIFLINLIFLILSFIMLRKILKLIDKQYLSIPLVILYGLSIGTISTVIFLRMYQMLVFFILLSLYLHIKIIKNEFDIDKKTRNILIVTTILGFLTQYYYCIFAFFEFLVLVILLLRIKKYDKLKKYIKYHIVSAIIGIALFPASIYHIFFSYRGIGAGVKSGLGNIGIYLTELCYAFSINEILALGFILILMCITIIFMIKKKRKLSSTKKDIFTILIIPTILSFFVICLISPQMKDNTIIRYISIIIPLVSMITILILDKIISIFIKNEKNINFMVILILVGILSIYGLVTSEPRYLYKGYNQILDIARENKDLHYIYICDNNFTYLSALPEFLVYDETMIINNNLDNLEQLKNDEELNNQDSIILNIKKWLDCDKILKDIIDYTKFNNYEILYDSNELESIIYKLTT